MFLYYLLPIECVLTCYLNMNTSRTVIQYQVVVQYQYSMLVQAPVVFLLDSIFSVRVKIKHTPNWTCEVAPTRQILQFVFISLFVHHMVLH